MSASDAVRAWLEARRPAPPAALRERMAEVLAAAATSSRPVGGEGAGEGGELVERLAQGALDRLRAVLASTGSRESALDLLAADALLTYACEAAAEAGAEALAALGRAIGPEQLANLLPEGRDEEPDRQ